MEETSLADLVSSIPVPSVKEIAKENNNNNNYHKVPQRYVRIDLESTFISQTISVPQLPIVDMSKLLSSDKFLMESELQKLHLASKEWGFFQLINHGVSDRVVESVKSGVEELFNLPTEEKKKFWQREGDIEGFGQAFVVSEDQKLDWADVFHLITLPQTLRKPHLLPQFPLHFRNSIEVYSRELDKIAKTLIELMAKALGIMEGKEMRDLFDGGGQTIRMNYYPPCPQPEVVIGLNPHSDATGLTILLQVNQTQGLQIRKDGMWVPVMPHPKAFVVNIGDMLEIVSNGIYRSVEHRATVNIAKERMSVATFHNPKINCVLGPAPSLVTPQSPPLFSTIGVSDYFKGYFSRELQGRSYMDVIRIVPN